MKTKSTGYRIFSTAVIIILAILSLLITVKVFASAKALPAVVGFCGVFAMLLIAWNTIADKIH